MTSEGRCTWICSWMARQDESDAASSSSSSELWNGVMERILLASTEVPGGAPRRAPLRSRRQEECYCCSAERAEHWIVADSRALSGRGHRGRSPWWRLPPLLWRLRRDREELPRRVLVAVEADAAGAGRLSVVVRRQSGRERHGGPL